jgi:hypothetical protein
LIFNSPLFFGTRAGKLKSENIAHGRIRWKTGASYLDFEEDGLGN